MRRTEHPRKRVWTISGRIGLVVVVLFVGVAVVGPAVTPGDPYRHDLRRALKAPGEEGFRLGSDHLGRDVLTRIVYGARVSLTIAVASVGFAVLIGIPLGLVAGFYGGVTDSVITRVMDVLLSLPSLLLAITIAAMYGYGFWAVVVAIGFPDVPIYARLTRASTLSLSKRDFVGAAQSLGSRDWRVLFVHILPNLLGPLVVQATFSLASAVLNAGALSFLGIGIQPPTAEWGSMIAQARSYMRVAPHLIVLPGVALAIVVLGINLLGDALRGAYDPRFRGRDS